MHMTSRVKKEKGFTLLFAALAGSLLFSAGIAIANIALRELALSSAGRESQFAFYAADTGAECALYWDRQESIFDGTPVPFNCAGKSITPSQSGTKASFTVNLAAAADAPCALVEVDKANGTKIESRGRNDCGAGDNPARVERAIRVRY
jgi:hypothetical protein